MSEEQPAGWYHAEGDPVDTVRYWDGQTWIGDPTLQPAATVEDDLASVGKRMGGRAIDFAIFLLLSIPFVGNMLANLDFEAISQGEEVDTGPSFVSSLLLFVVYFAWEVAWVRFKGGTPGKLIVGTRVAELNSRAMPPGWRPSVLRSAHRVLALSPILGFVGVLIGLASLIMLFVHDQRRTVMDLVAKTVVVNR